MVTGGVAIRSLLALVALALALAGCDDAARPAPEPHIVFDLSVSAPTGRPGAPITVEATVRNDGQAAATFFDCRCGSGIRLRAAGGEIYVAEEPVPCPAFCDQGEILPGQSRVWGRVRFDGRIWDWNGTPVDAPPGTYTAFTSFTWERPGNPTGERLERSVPFAWDVP